MILKPLVFEPYFDNTWKARGLSGKLHSVRDVSGDKLTDYPDKEEERIANLEEDKFVFNNLNEQAQALVKCLLETSP